jgi:branched-subunit amino acid ABC-type transport system permease component
VLVAVDFETFRQLTVDGFFRGCSYGLLGVGFALILGVTGRFHFAYGFTYTLAAYLAYTLAFRGPEFPFWPSAVAGILLAAVVGALMERFVYRPLAVRAGATALLAIFVAALGLGIAGGNLISLLYTEASQQYVGPLKKPYEVWDTIFINFDVWQAVTAIVITALLAAMLRYSALGRRIKATRVNPDLARAIGINAENTYVICFFLGTICAGVAAFFYALKFTITPSMGITPVIYAFVVAFLAGTARSPIRVLIIGIVVALIEQYSSIWLSVRWTQTAVFVVLVGYLTYLAVKSSAWSARIRIPGLRRA